MQLPRGAFVDAIVELETAGVLSADAKGNRLFILAIGSATAPKWRTRPASRRSSVWRAAAGSASALTPRDTSHPLFRRWRRFKVEPHGNQRSRFRHFR